jgi:two-component system sensor histidine kinase BaeS
MRRSIRWELPLSYAAIALLATVALGVVLLLILRGHYRQLEQAYLEGSALAYSYSLAPLLTDEPTAESLQAEVLGLSFLSQARVRLLDQAGSPLADSSTPGPFAVSLAPVPEGELWLPVERIDPEAGSRSIIAINSGVLEPGTISMTVPLQSRALFVPSQRDDPFGPIQTRLLPFGTRDDRPNPSSNTRLGGTRSDQAALKPIYDDGSNLLGYVELSEGPAYGQEIVTSVARGWLLAGAVAIAVAAVVGWFISRRISAPLVALTEVTASMASGDLSARADVARKDELGTLARSFNQMADQVEEIITSLRRFVSDAAHEIHTPLTALHTNLELAQRDVALGSEEHVLAAQAQVERLEGLTGGLLDLSRLESPGQAPQLAPVSLLPLVHEVGELYASRAEQAGLAFELSTHEAPVSVLGEEAELRAALTNLLDNALKFTPEGGQIYLGCRQEGEAAILWVEDTGIGFPEEDLPHLFDRFYRGSNSAAYTGSGLGLAIVKAVVDRHNGQVQVERTEQGARFTIKLPSV